MKRNYLFSNSKSFHISNELPICVERFQVWNRIEMFWKLWNESLIQRPDELIQLEIELFWKAMNESLELVLKAIS